MAVLNFWGLAMGIKVDTYNSALRVSHLCAIAALAFLAYLHPSSAHAQVAIEGTYSYSISQSGSQLSTKGTVAKLTNYNFSDYTGVRALIVLSKRSYSSGGTIRGETIAQSSVGSFPARTFFTNIPLHGSSKLPAKGNFLWLTKLIGSLSALPLRKGLKLIASLVALEWWRQLHPQLQAPLTLVRP